MTYRISELAKLSGVSTRTIRYYESIGLLCPERDKRSGYRTYDEEAVARLQHILILRALDMPLKYIVESMASKRSSNESVLTEHLMALKEKVKKIELVVETVENTLVAIREGEEMKIEDRFKGLRELKILENEKKYGKEMRTKYGNDAIEASNRKMMCMTPEDESRCKALEDNIAALLIEGVNHCLPSDEMGYKLVETHKEWLKCYWQKYEAQAHRVLAMTYVEDERFKQYYETIVEGGAAFISEAILHHIKG